MHDAIRLTMRSPVPVYPDESGGPILLARRPETLDARVVALLPNWRPSALKLLQVVGKLLEARYALQAVVMEQPAGELPQGSSGLIDAMEERLNDLSKRADVAITATGD